MSTSRHWPTEIRLAADKRTLKVSFDDNSDFELPAEYLRVSSPSAEVQGHSPDERQTVPGKRNVAIVGIDPVGSYAVRLRFDDGHDTGLFTWDYLHRLGAEQDELWSAYLADLAAKGLTRDPPRRH